MRQRRTRVSSSKSTRDMEAPLLSSQTRSFWWWLPCRGQTQRTNAETVQDLVGVLDGLSVAKQRALSDYEHKAAQVALLANQGHQRQAWESMQTAKQHKRRWDRCHTMAESVEQIKGRIMEQQHNTALFSSFSEASDQLARLLERTPVESVDDLLVTLEERMADAQQVGQALATPDSAPVSVDEDELAAFLSESAPSLAHTMSMPAVVPVKNPTVAPVVRRAMLE